MIRTGKPCSLPVSFDQDCLKKRYLNKPPSTANWTESRSETGTFVTSVKSGLELKDRRRGERPSRQYETPVRYDCMVTVSGGLIAAAT